MRARAATCEGENSGGSKGATGCLKKRPSRSANRSRAWSSPTRQRSERSARFAIRRGRIALGLLVALLGLVELLARLAEEVVEVLGAVLLATQRLVELVHGRAEPLA